MSIREVVHAIALDSRRVLPVSTLVNGPYGVRDVCLSVPTEVGCGGVRKQIELDRPLSSGFFVHEGLSPGDRVVIAGAQQLLSAELNASGAEE